MANESKEEMILRQNSEVFEIQNLHGTQQKALVEKKMNLANGTRISKPIINTKLAINTDTPFDTPDDHQTVKDNATFTNKIPSDNSNLGLAGNQKLQNGATTDDSTQKNKPPLSNDMKGSLISPQNGLRNHQGFSQSDVNSRKPPTPNSLTHLNTNKPSISPLAKVGPSPNQLSEQFFKKQDDPAKKRLPSSDNIDSKHSPGSQTMVQIGMQHQTSAFEKLAKASNFKDGLDQFNSAPSKLQDKGVNNLIKGTSDYHNPQDNISPVRQPAFQNKLDPVFANGSNSRSGQQFQINKGMNIQTTSPLRDQNGFIKQNEILSPTEIISRTGPSGKKFTYTNTNIESLKVSYSFETYLTFNRTIN